MSRQPEAIRARALAFARCLVREVALERGRADASVVPTLLAELASANALLRELLAQRSLGTEPATNKPRSPERAVERVV